MKIQKPVKGGRIRLYGSVAAALKRTLRSDSRRFDVSMNFVVNVALAEHLGVEIEEHYLQRPKHIHTLTKARRRRA